MRHLKSFRESVVEIPPGSDPRANEIIEIFQDAIDEFHIQKEKIRVDINYTNPTHNWMKIEVRVDTREQAKSISAFLLRTASKRIEHILDAHMFLFSTRGGYVVGFRDDRGNEILTVSFYSY